MADWTTRGVSRSRMQRLLSAERTRDAGLEAAGGGLPDAGDVERIAARLAAGPAAGASPLEVEGIARRVAETATSGLRKLDGAGAGALSAEEVASLEAVVHVRGRPAARVLGDDLEDLSAFPDSDRWALLFDEHRARVMQATGATAAVTVQDRLLPSLSWVQGTAVLVGHGLALTNRHVLLPNNGATRLARRRAGAPGGRLKRHYKVELDFAFDSGPVRDQRFEVTGVPFITADEDPVDAALVTIAPVGQGGPAPLDVSSDDILDLDRLYVVGHPGRLAFVPEHIQMVFGTPDDRKRVSFGRVMDDASEDGGHIVHDASTIGGYSGGPVLGFGSTEVMALHYWGDGIRGNRAIASTALRAHPGLARLFVA